MVNLGMEISSVVFEKNSFQHFDTALLVKGFSAAAASVVTAIGTSGHNIIARCNKIIQIEFITKQTVIVIVRICIHIDAQFYGFHVTTCKIFTAKIIVIVS